jgi:hypothetical protein
MGNGYFSCVCPLCSDDPEYRDMQDRDETTKQEIRNIQQQMIQEWFSSFFAFTLLFWWMNYRTWVNSDMGRIWHLNLFQWTEMYCTVIRSTLWKIKVNKVENFVGMWSESSFSRLENFVQVIPSKFAIWKAFLWFNRILHKLSHCRTIYFLR